MRRYWSEIPLVIDQEVELSRELHHHICDVCRLTVGAKFELLTAQQKAFLVELTIVSKKSSMVRVLEQRDIPALKSPYIRLCLSIPKFSTFESLLEKSVELGIHRVQPFFSDHSFVRSRQKISSAKWDRWQKIVKSSSQQSGRSPLMEIEPPQNLEEILQGFNPTDGIRGLFPYEGEGFTDLRNYLLDVKASDCREIWLFIGSEGGFSTREVQLFQSVDLIPLSLGEQVLRVETACVSIASIIKYELNLF